MVYFIITSYVISFGGQEVFVVRYKHVATYFCAQIVLEKSLYMGMSMVKALIVKVFRARRKKLSLMLCACICIKQARNSC